MQFFIQVNQKQVKIIYLFLILYTLHNVICSFLLVSDIFFVLQLRTIQNLYVDYRILFFCFLFDTISNAINTAIHIAMLIIISNKLFVVPSKNDHPIKIVDAPYSKYPINESVIFAVFLFSANISAKDDA